MQPFLRFWILSALLLAGWVASGFAQISSGGTPRSFSLALSTTVPTVQMAPVDAAAYLAEDTQAPKHEPYRFAVNIDVALNLSNAGVWENIPGGRLWRLRVASSGAHSIGLIYDRWHIPPGGELFIYNDEQSRVIGAFTAFNNWVDGTNVTHHVAGDAIIIEYFEPEDVHGQGAISIAQVCHAYRNLFGHPTPLDGFNDSGSCNNNVNCPEGAPWQTNKRGVALIVSNGSRICSGSLINNTAQNQTPYFLTANHCLGGNNTWVFVFNYESPGCTNIDGPTNQTVANSTLRANWSTSDFALLQLSSNVPSTYNPYFNGWNRTNTAASNSVCIHHPAGDIKKITFDYNAPVSSGYYSAGDNHWKILNWEDGTTEPGSSGSPLFDQNHRITGQLHGGDAWCGNNVNDYYGKFYYSWTGGGTNATRLSNWLDPSGTGVTTLDGLDGSAASITVTAPNGGETWIEGTVQSITWTSSNVTGNVNVEINRAYPGGAWESVAMNTANDGTHSWTVTTPATAAARVRVTSVNNTTVSDVSNANFTVAARTVTVTAPNGGESWVEGSAQNVTWTSSNLTGNVNIELNRSYPAGAWEPVAMNTANDGTHLWTVTLPASTIARVRVTSVSFGSVSDVSDAGFSIVSSNTPPVIAHDPLHDQFTQPFTVTAIVSDNAAGVTVKWFYWPVSGGPTDSAVMNATGYPAEFAVTRGPLAPATYGYYIRAIDIGGLSAVTATRYFDVGSACGTEQAYDDGTAEASHWSSSDSEYRWAVKFDPPATPYALCSGRIGISAQNPDVSHTQIHVEVFAADAPGGMPGSLLYEGYTGSIGNIVGGVPADLDNWAMVLFRDAAGNPLTINGSYYIAVSNPSSASYEAFLHDLSGAYAGRSFVYDPCDGIWYNENSGHESARLGNRMIRASGFSLQPPAIVVRRINNDIRLDWQPTGAPLYNIYTDTSPNGTFTTLIGSTSEISFTDLNPLGTGVKFYQVRAGTAP